MIKALIFSLVIFQNTFVFAQLKDVDPNIYGKKINDYLFQTNKILKGLDPIRDCPSADRTWECAAIKSYPRSTPLAMDAGKETQLCDTVLKKKDKDREFLNTCGDADRDTNSQEYVAPSRHTYQKLGYEPLTQELDKDPELKKQFRDAIMNQAESIRTEVADLCCGSDVECKTSVNKVDISFCQASAESNAPDSCSVSVFNMPSNKVSSIAAAFSQHYSNQPASDNPDSQEIQSNLKTINVAKDTQPQLYSGNIILFPYFRIHDPLANSLNQMRETLTHEMFHACDLNKAQLAATQDKDPKAALNALKRMKPYFDNQFTCENTEGLKDYYNTLWQSMGENSSLTDCLFHSLDLAQKKGAPEYCKNACKNHYYYELFAETAEIWDFKAAHYPYTYPTVACEAAQNTNHPSIMNATECLAQNSPHFQQNFKQAFQCEN